MAEEHRRLELVHALRESGFSASVLTTFNAYLPFYEEVVLRRLVAAGCHHNIVLMDARQCAAALADPALRPRRSGRDYALVPISARGAFHPKMLLRLGKKTGSLFVGSHNLTLAGFGMNAELTNRFDYGAKDARTVVSPFTDAADLLTEYVAAAPDSIREALSAVFDAAPWMRGPRPLRDDVQLLGTHPSSESLWAQLRDIMPSTVERVLVVAPFFDPQLELIRTVRGAVGDADVVVALDPTTAMVPAGLAATFDGARFVDLQGLLPKENRRAETPPYLHAKALWFESAEGDLLVTGSANAGFSAFLGDVARNAEAVVARRGDLRDIAGALGFDAFFDAPPITAAAWAEVAARTELDDTGGVRDDDGPVGVAIAVATADGFTTSTSLPEAAIFRVVDSTGAILGTTTVDDVGPPSHMRVEDEVLAAAHLLEAESDGCPVRHLIVHRPEAIAQNYTSDTRRALRQAIGSLDEDPNQLELLLRLSEKVIFDSDSVTREPSRLRTSGKSPAPSEPPPAPETLAVEPGTPRRGRPRPALASGDITVILDALIRKLGAGLPVGPPVAGKSEEELVGSDDPDDVPEPVLTDPEKKRTLAKACQKKVKRLLKRMLKQIDMADTPEGSARVVVQLAAVLGVLRALGMIQRREEWRKAGARLIEDKAVWTYFESSARTISASNVSVLAKALEWVGEPYEEHSVVAGFMVWLGWFCGVDVDEARRRGGQVGVREELWPWVQHLTYVAPHLEDDARAHEIAIGSIQQTPRRNADPDRWVAAHLDLLNTAAGLARSPDDFAAIDDPIPGDLVLLPARFEPRVRVIQRASKREVRGVPRVFVTVLDPNAESGERQFMTTKSKVIRPNHGVQARRAG